jgi:hypothetical protein
MAEWIIHSARASRAPLIISQPQHTPTMNTRTRILLGAAAAALGSLIQPSAHAGQISWGTAVNSSLFDSAGTNFNTGTGSGYTFAVGSFGSFVPTTSNMNLWATNWKPFDFANNTGQGGYNQGLGYVTSTADLDTDGTSSEPNVSQANLFNPGETGYLWVYNTQTYGVGTGMEWALITNKNGVGTDTNAVDDWLFPAWNDAPSNVYSWRASTSSSAIFGGVNSTQGAGDFGSAPGSFTIQTHTLNAVPVPEPSGALLAGIVGLLGIVRRRR